MTPVPWQNLSMIMIPPGQRLSLPIKKTIPNWPKFWFWILWREISAKRKEDWPLAEGRRVGEKPHWPSTPTNARLLAGQKCEETPCMKEGGTKSHKLVYATQVYLLYIRTAIVKSFHTCQPKSRFLAYSSNFWLPSTYLHFIEPFFPLRYGRNGPLYKFFPSFFPVLQMNFSRSTKRKSSCNPE